MSDIQGWFILVIALGFIAIAVQGVFRGWLPNGPNGYKRGEGVSRETSPLGFWFVFFLYLGAGLYGAAYAIRLLSAS
ncbi:MAG: hypothetical protein REI94_20530 [Moraxellaceae bacterium]|nr:hypothetical protein [Moraxellaceae bacterium]